MNFSLGEDMRADAIDLSIVVPLYNDADSVTPLLEAIARVFVAVGDESQELDEDSDSGVFQARSALRRIEVILVDDGSSDGTYGRAVEACARLPIATRVISLSRNYGQTAAMQAGIEAASGRLIATLDGDRITGYGDANGGLTRCSMGSSDIAGSCP